MVQVQLVGNPALIGRFCGHLAYYTHSRASGISISFFPSFLDIIILKAITYQQTNSLLFPSSPSSSHQTTYQTSSISVKMRFAAVSVLAFLASFASFAMADNCDCLDSWDCPKQVRRLRCSVNEKSNSVSGFL